MRNISQNIKRSGLEIWRKLHRNNDPKTYATTDGYRRMIEQLSSTRCKDEKELSARFDKLQAAFDQYLLVSEKEYSQEDKLHRLVDILPANMYHQLSTILPMENWKYDQLKAKVIDILNISHRFTSQEVSVREKDRDYSISRRTQDA